MIGYNNQGIKLLQYYAPIGLPLYGKKYALQKPEDISAWPAYLMSTWYFQMRRPVHIPIFYWWDYFNKHEIQT